MTDKPSRATVFDTSASGSALAAIGDAVRTRIASDRGDLGAGAVTLVRDTIETTKVGDSWVTREAGAIHVIRS